MNTNNGLLTEDSYYISYKNQRIPFRVTELTIFGTSRHGLLNMDSAFSSERNCSALEMDLTRRNEMIEVMCLISLSLFGEMMSVHLTPTEIENAKTALFFVNRWICIIPFVVTESITQMASIIATVSADVCMLSLETYATMHTNEHPSIDLW